MWVVVYTLNNDIFTLDVGTTVQIQSLIYLKTNRNKGNIFSSTINPKEN